MRPDEELRQQVIAQLRREPSIDSSSIGVAVKSGVVTLTGLVPTFGQKRVAERACQRVKGVKAIAEQIEVRPYDEHARSDSDIATAAVNALAWNIWVPKGRVEVVVENGWITLSGDVQWAFEKRAAENAVRDLFGVRGVVDMLKVSPYAEAQEVQNEIEKALKDTAIQESKNIKVETADGVVTLRGAVRTWLEREDAERAAYASPGVSDVKNYITIV